MKYVALSKVDNDILIRGDECITTLKELYLALTDPDCTEIELRKDFCDLYFTFPALCDFVENCGTVAPNVSVVVKDTVYTDTNGAVRDLAQYKTCEELMLALQFNPTKVIATVQTLCNYYFASRDEASAANNKVSELIVQIDELRARLDKVTSEKNEILETSHKTQAALQALVNRVNFRYEKAINPEELFVLKENSYRHVLYIKEVTRVRFVDTLLYYLQEIMKTMYTCPCRAVVIEPYYSYGRERLYEGYKPHWSLSYQDVYSGNIFMAGIQPKVMKDVLQNSSHVHYLVVLDRGGYMSTHVQGRNVSTLYTMADINDLPEGVKIEDTISYNEESLNIPYIEGFEEMSPEQRIQKYSSMPILQTLVNKLEEEL